MTESSSSPVPLIDLRAQYAAIRDEIRLAFDEVLETQQFILGPQLTALEQQIARRCGVRLGVGVASGTDALVLTLRALGLGPGHEVIVPAFSFIATASAVILTGARPVFADIEPLYFTLDPASVETRVTPKTRAIIAVHLYGHPAPIEALREIARHHHLFLIEDNAQALGATWRGRPTGSFGIAGCLSFYPTKNLGAYGDAGMVVTDSEELARHVRTMRNHGQAEKYVSTELGWNSRLDELQAAVLRVKLRHLDSWTLRRQAVAARYTELLASLEPIRVPRIAPLATHVFHQYTIRVANRDAVAARLAEQGIATAVHYPVPLHLQPVFAHLEGHRGQCPVAERAAEEVLSLPMYPELSDAQIERVASALANAVSAVRA
ncbi:MAG: DegT/DnrJ/EryC1/StrS family aminotransferase [Firmicutes bacterium]|nr:DegT/DnrJ/EryC1/StrS family aminotransferase [Bacillota bacterium]